MKKEVSAVIVLNDDKFLILRRSKTSRGSGFWNFPGGSVEKDEDIDVAGVRELKEEADLDVNTKDLDYLGDLTTEHLNIHFFITEKYKGEVKINKESDDFKWIKIKELDNYLFVGGGKLHPQLLREIKEYMGE